MATERDVGGFIKARRNQLGLSQEELGARIGRSQNDISRLESRPRASQLLLDVFEPLVRELGVEPEELCYQAGLLPQRGDEPGVLERVMTIAEYREQGHRLAVDGFELEVIDEMVGLMEKRRRTTAGEAQG